MKGTFLKYKKVPFICPLVIVGLHCISESYASDIHLPSCMGQKSKEENRPEGLFKSQPRFGSVGLPQKSCMQRAY